MALTALLASCATEMPSQPWTHLVASGIKISARPASYEDLVRNYGNPSSAMNPLVDYPSLVSQLRLLVFDVTIESPEHDVELITRQTTCAFIGAKDSPLAPAELRALDAQDLQEAWREHVDGSSKMPELVFKSNKALPGDLRASPGKPASGYLVFLGYFPKGGTAVLSLAMRSSAGDAGDVKLRVELPDLDKKKATGIFSQTAKEVPAASNPAGD